MLFILQTTKWIWVWLFCILLFCCLFWAIKKQQQKHEIWYKPYIQTTCRSNSHLLLVWSLISKIPHSSFKEETFCFFHLDTSKTCFCCVSEQSHWSGVCLRSWLMHLSSSDLKELSAHSPANDDCFASLLMQKPLLEYQIISVRFVDCIHAWLCLICSFSPCIVSPLPLLSLV